MRIDGYEMTAVTREIKPLIHRDDIRKNITKIYWFYDSECETEFYRIYFKPETVKSWYSEEYMEYTEATLSHSSTKEHLVNEWLDEIAYI